MKTIKYTDIKEFAKDMDYLLDLLNDYYFYKVEWDINTKEWKREELEELLNESYIYDNVNEKADWEVDIYNNKLTQWLADNLSAFDDYIDECGYNSDKSIYENIQMAQYLEIEREIVEEVGEFAQEFDINLYI